MHKGIFFLENKQEFLWARLLKMSLSKVIKEQLKISTINYVYCVYSVLAIELKEKQIMRAFFH